MLLGVHESETKLRRFPGTGSVPLHKVPGPIYMVLVDFVLWGANQYEIRSIKETYDLQEVAKQENGLLPNAADSD